jgi:Uma2 family endonuclease
MVSAAERTQKVDPTVYPVEERVGEDILQRWIVELFRPLVEQWLKDQGVKAFVGADQFIYYRQHDPSKRMAPDTYVLPGVEPLAHVPSWKTFETGIAPSFVLEVVSKDWEKDYVDAPSACAEAGVAELVVFDPLHESSRERYRFQVFRRTAKRRFTRVEVTNDDRVRARTLGCYLRAVGVDRLVRLRLATGAHGEAIVPTLEERERAQKEQERAQKEQERAQKMAALARVAELERELARHRAPSGAKKRRR